MRRCCRHSCNVLVPNENVKKECRSELWATWVVREGKVCDPSYNNPPITVIPGKTWFDPGFLVVQNPGQPVYCWHRPREYSQHNQADHVQHSRQFSFLNDGITSTCLSLIDQSNQWRNKTGKESTLMPLDAACCQKCVTETNAKRTLATFTQHATNLAVNTAANLAVNSAANFAFSWPTTMESFCTPGKPCPTQL